MLGLKISLSTAIFYAPYMSKEMSMKYGTPRVLEFLRIFASKSLLFGVGISGLYATQQYIY